MRKKGEGGLMSIMVTEVYRALVDAGEISQKSYEKARDKHRVRAVMR